ncbi:hypothetical protein ABK040_013130 [Willaertia magna]
MFPNNNYHSNNYSTPTNPFNPQFSNNFNVNPYLQEKMSHQNNYQFCNNNSCNCTTITGSSFGQPYFHNPQIVSQPNANYNNNNGSLLTPFQTNVPGQQIYPPIHFQSSNMIVGMNNNSVVKEEKKKEFNSISKKTPCKDWDKCQKTSDEKHVEKYFHPCKFGTKCKHQENQVHLNRYLHPCPKGDNCKKLKNEEHCTFFIHSKESKPITSLYSFPGETDICMNNVLTCKKKDNNRFHMVSLRHICFKGENCTEIDNSEHKRYFLHYCKYKEACRYKENKAHSKDFIHPCKHGGKCKKYLEGEMPHIVLKSHVLGDTSTLEVFNWPTEWASPAPLKLSKDPLKKPHYAKISITIGTNEYQIVENLFKATLSNPIQSIHRIENYKLWFWFCQKRKKMGNNCNERKLFHGTAPTTVDLISKDGLDARVSGYGNFGEGIYTSPYASYSNAYTSSSPPKYMFVVRALVGDTYNVAGNLTQQGLKRAPPKNNGNTYNAADHHLRIMVTQKSCMIV